MILWRWSGGQTLRPGVNWNARGGFPEIVLYWQRRDGRRFRLYLRMDSPRHPRGIGVTTDACYYDVDAQGRAMNVQRARWWPWWLRQGTA